MSALIARWAVTAAIAFCWGVPVSVTAGDSGEVTAADVVKISAGRLNNWYSYQRVQKGIFVFERLRSVYGPDATLRFKLQLFDSAESSDLPAAEVRLGWSTGELPLQLDANDTFTIPAVLPEGAEQGQIQVNRKKTSYSIVAQVRTAGWERGGYRLGDVRLECEIMWAIKQEDVSFFLRTGIRALGGPCKSANGHYSIKSGTKITEATLQQGEKQLALSVSGDGSEVYLPLYDEQWSHGAHIHLAPAQ